MREDKDLGGHILYNDKGEPYLHSKMGSNYRFNEIRNSLWSWWVLF